MTEEKIKRPVPANAMPIEDSSRRNIKNMLPAYIPFFAITAAVSTGPAAAPAIRGSIGGRSAVFSVHMAERGPAAQKEDKKVKALILKQQYTDRLLLRHIISA